MLLQEFVTKFISRNSLIRLWYKSAIIYRSRHEEVNSTRSDHVSINTTMLGEDANIVYHAHEFINNAPRVKMLGTFKVLYISDIVVHDTFYPEAINIIVDINK